MTDPTEFPSPEEPARRRSPAPPGSTEEALQRLEERLDRASRAAERLIAEAAAAAAGGGGGGTGGDSPRNPRPAHGEPGGPAHGEPGGPAHGEPGGPAHGEPAAEEPPAPPASGWQIPEDSARSDLDPFVTLVQALRDLIPPELQRRLVAALRELLLALRALIDWYLERLERQRGQAVEVQDIPIL
jgi:hypothetical protein